MRAGQTCSGINPDGSKHHFTASTSSIVFRGPDQPEMAAVHLECSLESLLGRGPIGEQVLDLVILESSLNQFAIRK